MVSQGYFKDEYIGYFVSKHARRSPLINLGYYVRAVIIDKVLFEFIKRNLQGIVQILSLGAGFDTSFFRLSDHPENKNVVFYEIDLPEVVRKKSAVIRACSKLKNILKNEKVSFTDTGLWSENYRLMAGDLRELSVIKNLLEMYNFDYKKPTLLLSECSITYMDEISSRQLIKFAQEILQDAIFVTYEQIGPDDGFGIVMTDHFININSPLLSISTYPSLEAQEMRFKIQGWERCCSLSVWDAFVSVTSQEERSRALTLEPFDEWEEWHLKCNHYALVVATKGSLCDWMPFPCTKILKSLSEDSTMNKYVEMKFHPQPDVKQFGHSSVIFSKNEHYILTIGGFGQLGNGSHKRLDKLRCFKIASGSFEEIDTVNIGDGVFNCIHHSCVLLHENNSLQNIMKFILYGGRTSPLTCVNKIPLVVNCKLQENVLFVETKNLINETSSSVNAAPEPRWRHTTCIISCSNFKTFILFGGCTKQLKVFGDLWKINLNVSCGEYKWKQIHCCNSPCSRFSHSVTVNFDTMIISGGIDSNLEVLSDVWVWSSSTEVWEELSWVKQVMIPRYGHTSHFIGNSLIVIGGTTTQSETCPGVAVINFKELSCLEFMLPYMEPSKSVMLQNHSSVLKDETSIYIIGGGGNCFSFGTKFNSYIIEIPLSQWQLK
ncbi:tRNA wybutosine-synthesizing protein 4-like isoform X2 [Lycorma delicatula]